MASIRKIIDKLYAWRKYAFKPSKTYSLPLLKRLKYSLEGYSVDDYYWFELDKNNKEEYLSSLDKRNSREINGEYKLLLDDKLVFEEIFSHYARVPKNYATIIKGNLYELHDSGFSLNSLDSFLTKKGSIVVKPNKGYEGKGVLFIEKKQDKYFINKIQSSLQDVIEKIKELDDAIICEFIDQSDYGKYLYPDSVNTLRVLVARKNGEPSIRLLKAVQRFGNSWCKGVDNFSKGGYAATVNLKTGELGKFVEKEGDPKYLNQMMSVHPDTGNKIEGYKIPNWEKIKSGIIELTNKIPYLNLVAWDLIVFEDGTFAVIEGNASCDSTLLQIDKGEKKGEIGEIYRSYGVIR